jgi:apolipoprotein N-acyltransferase
MRFRRASPTDPAQTPRSNQARMLIAATAGAGGVLAFAPFGYWPLQIASLAILFYQVLRASTARGGALVGAAYGFGWSLAGVHWLYVAMHTFGAMPAPVAALAVVLMGLFMGAYVALAMGSAAWLRQQWALRLPLANLLVLPATWALFEWLRGWAFTGFPWVVSGYAHSSSPLAGFAPLLGVYGLGWFAALCAGAVLLLPHRARYLALAIIGTVFGAGQALKSVAWTEPDGRPISVRLLQGNVPQSEKFAPERINESLALYQGMIMAQPADLIATPETAVPLFPQQLAPDYLARLARFATESNSHLIVGIPLSDGPTRYANSAIGMAPGPATSPVTSPGAVPYGYRYDKHHLVPFGEFIPTGFRWFTDLMQIPLGDFTRGANVQLPFPVKDQLVLPNICYEDLFGEEIADQLAAAQLAGRKPATMLLNLSNLAWYGDSIAIPQHLQISQMRSLETGRPMLRATNTGATAVINGRGQVTHRLAPDTRATLAASVQGMKGLTPYILYGNSLFLTLAMLSLGGAGFLERKFRKNAAKTT